MSELILRFQRLPKTEEEFDQPIPLSVHFDGADTETFRFTNPLKDKDLTGDVSANI